MTNMLCLDENFSTTKVLTKVKPKIINNPNDLFETVLFLPMGENRKGEGGLRTKGYFKKSYENKPLISIITVVYNGEKHLQDTIQSVINQTYDNVEYIVIDGGSTDGTLDIIKKYEDKIDYWVSEKDKGISDAFNKGIFCCTGDLIGLINADDWYELDAFSSVTKFFVSHITTDIVYANQQYWKMNKREYILFPNVSNLLKDMTINHPATFIRSSVYKRYGCFNMKYKYAMDYDLLLRFFIKGVIFSYLNLTVSNMRLEGVSYKNWLDAYKETRRAKIENLHYNINIDIYFLFQVIRTLTRFLLEKIGFYPIIKCFRKYFSITKKTG